MEIERQGDQTDPGREEQTDLEKENEEATAATSSSNVLDLGYKDTGPRPSGNILN